MAKKTHLDVVTRFSSDISLMSGDIAKIQDKLNKINLGDSLNKSLQSTLQKLEKELNSFQQKANAGISDKTDLANLEKSFQKINGYYKTLSSEIVKLDDVTTYVSVAFLIMGVIIGMVGSAMSIRKHLHV